MKSTEFRITSFLLGFVMVLAGSVGVAQDWPSIRGPHYDGSASGDVAALASGPLQLEVVWKHPVGSGYSGIVTSGDRIVTAMADAETDQEFVVAMSAQTGEVLWKTPTGKIFKGANGSFDGPIATPAVDDVRAYHLSPFGDLVAYSLSDGSKIWSHNLKDEFHATPNFYGFGASPMVHSGVLIVAVGAPDAALMAFDVASGEVVWKAGEDTAAFQSAVPVVIDGETAVVGAGDTTLFAVRPTDGEIIWSQPHGGASGAPAWAIIPVPVSDGGLFLADSRDGSTVVDVALGGASKRWSGREIRNSYCVPVTAGGLLCSYSSRFLTAVDPETGDRLWRTRSPGNGFLGTVAGRLVAATMDGTLHIGDVSSDGFQEVAATEVFTTGDEDSEGLVWSLPSIAGRSIYLRSLGAVARVDIRSGNSATAVASDDSVLSTGFASFIERLESSENKQAVIDEYLRGKSMPFIEDDIVHFVFQGDHQDVAVASELVGIRQERSMRRVGGTNLFYYGIRVPESTRASYVFYADYHPTVDPGNPHQVVSTTLAGEMEPTFMGPAEPLTFSWFDKGDVDDEVSRLVDDASENLAGTLRQTQLKSEAMEETIPISVYAPPGYDDSSSELPVVFVHEGKVAMESGHQASVVDKMISSGTIRPAIVVFIQRRFYPMLGANGYAEMFADELLPMIEKSYRVSADRDDRASLSGGFGATLSLIGTLPASDRIGRIGCHSPFAFDLLHPMIKQLAGLPNERCRVLVQWGEYEFRNPSENWNMADQSELVADMLREGGHSVTAEQVPIGTDWVCWRTQSETMWRFLVGKAN